MTMYIQIINPKETSDCYNAKITIDEGEAKQEIILKPGEVSEQICIYDGKSVKVEEIQKS